MQRDDINTSSLVFVLSMFYRISRTEIFGKCFWISFLWHKKYFYILIYKVISILYNISKVIADFYRGHRFGDRQKTTDI